MINRELATQIKGLMPISKKDSDPNKPISMWTEKDRLRGYTEPTAVVIFRTSGCSWYKFTSCSMCGYFNDVSPKISLQNLKNQVDSLMNFLGEIKILKVFTSGSFLDPLEFPLEARKYFLDQIGDHVSKLLVESRTEYITNENLNMIKDTGIPTRIAIGLESANDDIMKNIINKGSTFKKYKDASDIVNRMDLELRTYLLFKPLFLSEQESIDDILFSIDKVSEITDDVSVNPMNIQRNTLVEYYWKRAMYRLPRLWSVAKILLESSTSNCEVISYPTGGNSQRGAHNSKIDKELLSLIYSASLTQDFSSLKQYYDSADLSQYNFELEIENKMPVQHDAPAIMKRLTSASQSL
ncbi:MAG: archaeosine biosynthesis radical SAM protein RaSEA [Thermoplasmataceae archaeon]